MGWCIPAGLLLWALVLCFARWQLRGIDPVNPSEGSRSSRELLALLDKVQRDIHEVQACTGRLAQKTFLVQSIVEELNTTRIDALITRLNTVDSAANDPQRVFKGDAFLKATRSSVPGLAPDDVFCDQLINTLDPSSIFGGSMSLDRLAELCMEIPLRVLPEHVRQIPDSELPHFAVMKIYRSLYNVAQFQDRITRYRELFRPMIDAVERRTDAMLYNYI